MPAKILVFRHYFDLKRNTFPQPINSVNAAPSLQSSPSALPVTPKKERRRPLPGGKSKPPTVGAAYRRWTTELHSVPAGARLR